MKTRFFLLTLLSAGILFYSCSSVPENISENMTSQELIQRGQENFENGNYPAALKYYNTAVERFAEWPSVYIEARYEIAHVYMKQKKYDKAEPIFNELIQIYRNSAPGAYPAAFKKLSELGLQTIEEKRPKKN